MTCFMLAVYLTILQILRYLENNDASVIAFKRFNEPLGDKYPTFTFCFGGDPYVIFSDAINELHIDQKEYSSV